ncbi:dipeptidase PepV, partial [Staphylococcus caprae]
FVQIGERYLFESHFGEKMGMKFHTDNMGDVTTNVGVVSYDNQEGGKFGVNLRYPQGFEFDKSMARFEEEIKAFGFSI